MSIIEAFFQAVIQGITEFLPVSSSGHLSLYQHFTGVSGESGILFSLILHVGTILAVFIAFHKIIIGLIKEFFVMLKEIFTNKFKFKDRNPNRNMIIMIIVSLLPMLVFYFLKDFYLSVSSDNDIIVEGVCFLITAILLFVADRCVNGKKNPGDITARNAITIGIFQGIAPLPGVSRSGSTISAGLICGLTKETAVQFSFIMGIPAILGASILELKDITSSDFNIGIAPIVVGLIVSAVVGLICIKLLRWLIKSNKFKIFVYYTLIIGLITISIGIFEVIVGTNIIEYFKVL